MQKLFVDFVRQYHDLEIDVEIIDGDTAIHDFEFQCTKETKEKLLALCKAYDSMRNSIIEAKRTRSASVSIPGIGIITNLRTMNLISS